MIVELKNLTFFELQEVTINEIYSTFEIPKLVNTLDEELKDMSEEYENEPAWFKQWSEYGKKGIKECNTKEDLARIILPQSPNSQFSTIIETLQSEIPALASRFQVEIYNDDLVILKYNVNNTWQEVTPTKPHAIPHVFTTPATSLPTNTPNPFAVLAVQNDANAGLPETDNISQQLSQQFSSSNLTPESDKSNATLEVGTLTIEKYQEIVALIKDGRQDEVSLSDFEKYFLVIGQSGFVCRR